MIYHGQDTVSLKFLNDNLKHQNRARTLFSSRLAPVTGETGYPRTAKREQPDMLKCRNRGLVYFGTGKNALFAFDTEDENDLSAAYTIKKHANTGQGQLPHTGNGDNIIHGFRGVNHNSVRLQSDIPPHGPSSCRLFIR